MSAVRRTQSIRIQGARYAISAQFTISDAGRQADVGRCQIVHIERRWDNIPRCLLARAGSYASHFRRSAQPRCRDVVKMSSTVKTSSSIGHRNSVDDPATEKHATGADKNARLVSRVVHLKNFHVADGLVVDDVARRVFHVQVGPLVQPYAVVLLR